MENWRKFVLKESVDPTIFAEIRQILSEPEPDKYRVMDLIDSEGITLDYAIRHLPELEKIFPSKSAIQKRYSVVDKLESAKEKGYPLQSYQEDVLKTFGFEKSEMDPDHGPYVYVSPDDKEWNPEAFEYAVSRVNGLLANKEFSPANRPSFAGVDLSGADLTNSSFKKYDFRGANLQDADLQGSNFQGSNFEGANLQDAKYNQNTILPDDLDPEANGMDRFGFVTTQFEDDEDEPF